MMFKWKKQFTETFDPYLKLESIEMTFDLGAKSVNWFTGIGYY